MDKNPHIKTVVTKTGTIETKFRTFPMEVIAGKHDFDVRVKEHNVAFEFNFAEVYWNSRLQEEHSTKRTSQKWIVTGMRPSQKDYKFVDRILYSYR